MFILDVKFRMIFAPAFALLLCITAYAQFRAGIQGTVTDANGALVPDAAVTLTSNEMPIVRRAPGPIM